MTTAAQAKQQGYTTRQVSEMTGASLRQLQVWDELKVVPARHFKHSRIYTREQVEMIGRFVQLRKLGASPRQIWNLFDTFGWDSKVVVSKRDFAMVDDTLVLFAGQQRKAKGTGA